MNDNVSIEGEIDAQFTSYWDSGETVGKEETEPSKPQVELLPAEVDADEITALQFNTVLAAVRHQQKSTDAIGDLIGKEGGYVRATLQRVCPIWYENTFKNAGSEGGPENPFLNTVAQTCDDCGSTIVIHDPMNGNPKARCGCRTFPLRPLPDEWSREGQ